MEVNDKISINSKSPVFEDQKLFSAKFGSVMHIFIWNANARQNLEKKQIIPLKHWDRR